MKLKSGFSLLELVLAVAIFSMASISIGYLIIDATGTTDINNKKIETIFLAREGIEAVRSIRNADGFATLVSNVGDNGLDFDSETNTWSFAGASENVADENVYTRVINITLDNATTTSVVSTVSATSGARTISTSLETKFTDWQ